MSNDRDIFDRIMSCSFFHWFEPFYKRYKATLLYLFFGGVTTVISVVTFTITVYLLSSLSEFLSILIANIISWVIAVTIAYITNRIWVFKSKASGRVGIIKECAAFFAGRIVSLVIETLLLEVLVALWFDELIAKIIVTVVTVVLNYIISKCFVFRKKDTRFPE